MSKLELLKVNVDLGLISQAYGGLSIDDITASMTGSTESLRVERYVAMLLDGIQKEDQDKSVSYTHLTLPTNREV